MADLALWTSDTTNSNGEYEVVRIHRQPEMLDSTQLNRSTLIDDETDVVDDGGEGLWLDKTNDELHLR
jgi:hypothetical protein